MSFKKAVARVEGLLAIELNKHLRQGCSLKDAWALTLKTANKHMTTHPRDRYVWQMALKFAAEKLQKLLEKLIAEEKEAKKTESEAADEQHAP